MSMKRRVAELETIWPPQAQERDGLRTDRDRDHYLFLTVSASIAPILWMAQYVAERRFLHERGLRSFHIRNGITMLGHGDGWGYHLPLEDQDRLHEAELERLLSLLRTLGQEAGLNSWLAEPDAEGWPPHWLTATTREELDDRIAGARRRKDSERGASSAIAARWRHDHPAWRLGMTGEEAWAFEFELDNEAARLEAEWFGTDAA